MCVTQNLLFQYAVASLKKTNREQVLVHLSAIFGVLFFHICALTKFFKAKPRTFSKFPVPNSSNANFSPVMISRITKIISVKAKQHKVFILQ